MRDVGYGKGKNYSINFPLNDGIDDQSFVSIFKPVIAKIMEKFAPSAIVLQVHLRNAEREREKSSEGVT